MLQNSNKTKVFISVLALLLFATMYNSLLAQDQLKDSLKERREYFESQPNYQPKDTNYLKTLYRLARSYAYQDYDSLKIIGQRVIDLSMATNFEEGVAGGYLALATGATLNGEFEKGFDYAKKAEKYALSSSIDTIELKALNVQSMSFVQRGDYPKGYIAGRTGLLKAEKYKNEQMQFMFTMNLATTFALTKDTKNALKYYEDALELLENTNDSLGFSQIKSNLSYLEISIGNYNKAENYAKEALDYLKRKGVNAWAAFASVNAAEASIKNKQLDKAIYYLYEAEELLKSIDDKQREAEKDLAFAEVYFIKNDLDNSKTKALLGEKKSKSINYFDGIIRASKILYEINKKSKNNNIAIAYLETATRLSDSIQVESSKTKLLMLETQTAFELEQSRLRLASQEALEKQKFITTISVVSLIILIVILFLIRRNIHLQKKANARLQEISRAKDQVFSIIGHDLKTPIGTLQELLSLYGSEKLSTEEFLKIAPKLKSNVDHSAFTLNNLLFWAQQQMNGLQSKPENVNIKKVSTNVVALHQEQIDRKNITVVCAIPEAAEIYIDPEHLNIILRNIISNAIKFTNENGKITFDFTEGAQPTLKICDDGIGMSQTTISDIMSGTPISKPGTINEKGTGIGLNICRELLKLNKGDLRIQSSRNQGSCLEIVFSSDNM